MKSFSECLPYVVLATLVVLGENGVAVTAFVRHGLLLRR